MQLTRQRLHLRHRRRRHDVQAHGDCLHFQGRRSVGVWIGLSHEGRRARWDQEVRVPPVAKRGVVQVRGVLSPGRVLRALEGGVDSKGGMSRGCGVRCRYRFPRTYDASAHFASYGRAEQGPIWLTLAISYSCAEQGPHEPSVA